MTCRAGFVGRFTTKPQQDQVREEYHKELDAKGGELRKEPRRNLKEREVEELDAIKENGRWIVVDGEEQRY